ncbi:hypothetical protein Godav_011619 [Gossypium davidsonii]|uniref:Protein kinase domain-containing protein n=1 Tax=Gossypium davidsonii TaxID=34287 RepID=A0A7J8RBV9_GOSDV|nr:hypothetical protein [Gossypium davidsonii]
MCFKICLLVLALLGPSHPFSYSLVLPNPILIFCVASLSLPSTVSHTCSDPPTPPLKTTQLHFHPRIAFLITVSLVLLLALSFAMGLLFRCYRLRKLERRKSTSTVQPDQIKGNDLGVDGEGFVRKFRWEEIKAATKDFSRVIGQGGFSNVYLANLSGSSRGAVKIHAASDRLNQVFKQELDILLRLRHDNIVKLLGYCNDLGTLHESTALLFQKKKKKLLLLK